MDVVGARVAAAIEAAEAVLRAVSVWVAGRPAGVSRVPCTIVSGTGGGALKTKGFRHQENWVFYPQITLFNKVVPCRPTIAPLPMGRLPLPL